MLVTSCSQRECLSLFYADNHVTCAINYDYCLCEMSLVLSKVQKS